MSAVLESVSLFPYMHLWRLGGKPEVNHKFGGCVSILLILAIGAIAAAKLVQVSKMTTITATQQNQISFVAPMTNLTTSFTDPNMQQYMFAIKISVFGDQSGFSDSEYSSYAYYSIQSFNTTTKTYSYNNTYFYLQRCTINHFYKLPDVNSNFLNWGMDLWWCLPINKTYQIGGSSVGDYKSLTIGVSCMTSSCQYSQYKSIVIHAFTYNTFVNPTNGSNPFTSYINKYETIFQSYTTSRTFFYLQKNTLTTDSSLLPYTQKTTNSSLRTTDNFISNSYSNYNGPSTYFFISHSGTTVNYNRYYQKYLNAFAYIGGIFNALLGAFFFMNTFGGLFFEMEFASRYFNKEELSKVNLFTPIKQIVYNVLVSFDKRPDWQYSNKVEQFKSTINNLVDVIYLQKRLQFLEKCMEILFDKHHLKGLYLMRRITRQEADQKHRDHNLRDRIILIESGKEDKNRTKTKTTQKQDCDEKKKKPNQSQQRINTGFAHTEIEFKRDHCLNNQKLERQEKNEQAIQKKEYNGDNEIIASHDTGIEQFSEEQATCLIKLCRQAKQKKGDLRSRKIFEKLDKQLQNKLEEMSITYNFLNIRSVLNV